MFYEVTYLPIGKILLVRPLLCAEHTEYAIERVRVSQLNTTHGTHDSSTKILGTFSHILPVASVRDDKAVLFWKRSKLFIATTFLKGIQCLFIVHIADALVIENRRYIILKVVLTHRPAYDITSLKQEAVQVLHTFQLQFLRGLGLVKHVSSVVLFFSHNCNDLYQKATPPTVSLRATKPLLTLRRSSLYFFCLSAFLVFCRARARYLCAHTRVMMTNL